MESVLGKLKVGTEDLYIKCQCGNTPVLSLLGIKIEVLFLHNTLYSNTISYVYVCSEKILLIIGDIREEPKRPFVNDNNIIMYLDMINEKIVELKGICQFLEFQDGKVAEPVDPKLLKKKQDKKDRPASAALGKKDDGKDGDDGSDSSDIVSRPLDVTDLKTKAFVVTSRNESSNEINLVTVMVNNLYKS